MQTSPWLNDSVSGTVQELVMSKRLCEVFKSPRREGMYLYVDRAEGLARVPDTMLAGFGSPQSVLVLVIDASRRLARADAAQVLESIEEQGFYLQMPPAISGSAGDASENAIEQRGEHHRANR